MAHLARNAASCLTRRVIVVPVPAIGKVSRAGIRKGVEIHGRVGTESGREYAGWATDWGLADQHDREERNKVKLCIETARGALNT